MEVSYTGCLAQGYSLHLHHVGGKIKFTERSQRFDILLF